MKQMPSRRDSILVDSGFFFALFDPRDPYHDSAVEKLDYLEVFSLAVPWPIIYETFNTRFSRRPNTVARFKRILAQPHTELLDDTNYRREALANAYRSAVSRIMAVSLVDAILFEILNDINVRIHGMLTFNHRDFAGVCRTNGVEII